MALLKITIVGGGRGGSAVLRALHSLKGVEIIGLSDVNKGAEGIKLARKMGIKTSSNFEDFLNVPDLDLVIEATGVEKVRAALHDKKKEETIIVDAKVTKLMMDLVDAKETMVNQLHDQAQELAVIAQQLTNYLDQMVNASTEVAKGAENISVQENVLIEAANEAKTRLQETDKILQFIRMVAEETKLLGLNAAIEAARAGEHGRGFTVVAHEVRKLAENSTASANQISQILNNMEKSVNAIFKGVGETGEIVKKQTLLTQELVDNTRQLEKMAENVSELASNLAEIE